MNRKGFSVAIAILSGFLLCVGLASAEDDQVAAHYSAVAVPTTGLAGGQSTTIDIHISGQTSDQEAQRLVQVLNQQGQDALVNELRNKDLGKIGATGSVGIDLAVVRVHPTEKGKTIRLVAVRDIPFVERFLGGRSTNYPFTMAEFTVNDEGKGEGRLIVGAKVKVNDAEDVIIESYSEQSFVRLLNIRRLD